MAGKRRNNGEGTIMQGSDTAPSRPMTCQREALSVAETAQSREIVWSRLESSGECHRPSQAVLM
jgi:hypothetical protein